MSKLFLEQQFANFFHLFIWEGGWVSSILRLIFLNGL